MPSTHPPCLTPDALSRALALRDLTDPAQGPHAMQLLLDAVVSALRDRWRAPVRVERAHPVVAIADNYDALRYPPDGAARDARHTRYVAPGRALRTQTSAMIPPLLRRLAAEEASLPDDLLLVCPGLVWRRDTIDRHHVGEPHQVDLWRLRRGDLPLGEDDLEQLIRTVAVAALPGLPRRTQPASHPYTRAGRQVDVSARGAWVEIGECGLAHPDVLAAAGLGPAWSGLAMGLGLDRLLMLAKGIDDIRLLRSEDPRVAVQLQDLAPYRPVSRLPPVRRDLSLAVADGVDAEALGDRVREALGPRARDVEAIEVRSETPGPLLPPAARARLGLEPGQKNVLLRVVLRPLDRTLTDAEANGLRDAIYAALHDGGHHEWAARAEACTG